MDTVVVLVLVVDVGVVLVLVVEVVVLVKYGGRAVTKSCSADSISLSSSSVSSRLIIGVVLGVSSEVRCLALSSKLANVTVS